MNDGGWNDMERERLTNQFIQTHKEQCCGCHACANICPVHAIEMREDEEGFLYPHVDEGKCVKCGRCAAVCQMMNGRKSAHGCSREVYACMNLNMEERMASSSGGVFILLAKQVLAQGGQVFGAAFDEKAQVRHEGASDLEGCRQFMGSKYVQSTIGNTFSEAKRLLEKGVPVLFSGTPCQIHGLRLFLGKDYENLYTVDIICHGVPSPEVFSAYKTAAFEIFGKKVCNVQFRDKSSGWKQYSITWDLNGGEKKKVLHGQSAYMKGFLSDLYLRPSCYQCQNKEGNYFSDLTLGDYWGVEKKDPDMDDDKGTSVVLLHTDKGRALFGKIRDDLKIKTAELEYVIRCNSSIVKLVDMNPNRNHFFRELKDGTTDVHTLIWKYQRRSSRWVRCREALLKTLGIRRK